MPSGASWFAALLADRRALRTDLSIDRAADAIWALCSQATFESLVTARGWTHLEYRDWLADMLAKALLRDHTAASEEPADSPPA